MFKNLFRMAITLAALWAAYVGYCGGFAILSGFVATYRSVPKLPTIATASNSNLKTTALAAAAFGPDHWAVKADMRYYVLNRGYCLYWRDQVRCNDGKSWELKPIAVVALGKDGRGLKTITADQIEVDFNRAFDATKPGDEPVYATHALMHGNVTIRDDKGTPSIADDLRSEPIASLEFDDKTERIQSGTEERIVFYQGGTTVRGTGLIMELLRRSIVRTSEAGSNDGTPDSGFEGVSSITLLRDVDIDVLDVGRSGIVPGGAKVSLAATKDGTTKVVKREPKPGHIQSAGTMRIDLARSHIPARVGPPAPSEPTIATFVRNVRVQQGVEGALDQLDCDRLIATLLPPPRDDNSKRLVAANDAKGGAAAKLAAKTGGATTKDQPKAEPDDDGSVLGNLVLHRAHATGHAVWLQSTAQHLRAVGNELTYQKFGPGEPDQLYLRGDRQTEVVKTEFHESGKDAGKPRYVDTIRTRDVTIYRYPPGGPAPSFVARGPGTMETRVPGGEDLERFVSWRDELQVVPILGTDMRKVTILGYPRVRSATQGSISADKKIVADLAPKTQADVGLLAVATADGQPLEPVAAPEKRSSDAMRLKHVKAFENVQLVTAEVAADSKATPPRLASPSRELLARRELDVDFVEAPVVPKPAALPKEKLIADAPKDLEAVVDAATPAVEPAPKPAEPAMHAEADSVTAVVMQQAGSDRGRVEKATLTGAAEVHQDPAKGKTQGTDITGDVIHFLNRGENRGRFQAHGTKERFAKAVTEERNIQGRILQVDQADDHAWVIGMGRLEMEQKGTDFLDDTAKITTAKDQDEPEEKKGPLVITWGRDVNDKNAMMHFHGRTVLKNGQPGPAQATFYSHVLAQTDDSSASCEGKLTATFDAPIPFVRLKRDPSKQKGEKEPGPEIATVLLEKDAVVISRKNDSESGFLKDKKRIVCPRIFYDKAIGEFTGVGPGEVFLYTTSSGDDGPGMPLAGDRRVVKPATAHTDGVKPKKPSRQPQLKLTQVRFQKRMDGRFAAPRDAQPGDYSSVLFIGSVEAMSADVKDENVVLDADNPPDEYYRTVSDFMTVTVEPPLKKDSKEKDRILLEAWGHARAHTRQKAIVGERITYDSMNELTYVYGGARGVSITNQDGVGQPFSSGLGSAVRHNNKTGQSQLINPKTFELIDPDGKRGVAVPIEPPPLERRNVGAVTPPGRPVKRRDPQDPAQRARQLRLPPRSNLERRGFNGR